MSANFIVPNHIITGKDAWQAMEARLHRYGTNALIVTGGHSLRDGTVSRLQASLAKSGLRSAVFDDITGEPTDSMVEAGVAAYRENGCDFFIGVGGGSVLDAMKAIAVMTVLPGSIREYMGREIHIARPPMVAVPTTAGTGSEATQVTIITDSEQGVKMLLKGAALMPDMAVVDPAPTVSMPPHITAWTALDALTHAVEAYTSRKAQPLTDTLALSAVKRIFTSLPTVLEHPKDFNAREELSIAALEAGMAFNNASVTLVHGMSRPIGALFHVPHGLSNAMLLQVCLRYALPDARERFAALGRAVGAADEQAEDKDAAEAFLRGLKKLCLRCRIPTLREYGIDRETFFDYIEKMALDAVQSGSPANTRRPVDAAAIMELYTQLWDDTIKEKGKEII